jgi:hypothetical protein
MHRTLTRPTAVAHVVAASLLTALAAVSTSPSARATTPAVINVPGSVSTIQGAIQAAAPGDTIVVQPGTYHERIDFIGKAVTLTSYSGAEGTVIDGDNAGTVVTFKSGEGAGSILRGFTVQHGNAIEAGGVLVRSASPRLENNVITANTGCLAGGIRVAGGAPTIAGNTITLNGPVCTGGGPLPGGVEFDGFDASGAVAKLVNNVISYNRGGNGAAVGVNGGNGLIQDNVIKGNVASDYGGAIYTQNGAAVQVVGNLIVQNSARSSGAIYSSPVYGGIGLDLVNNTIADNQQQYYATVFYSSFGDRTKLFNNIITAPSGSVAVGCDTSHNQPFPTFVSNDVFVPAGTAYEGCPAPNGAGNISADPVFIDTRNYQLSGRSPAVDAGYSSAPGIPALDLAGNPRWLGRAVDMGALELQQRGPIRCNATFPAVTLSRSIVVAANASCGLDHTTVRGDVTVGPGGYLDATGAKVDGDVRVGREGSLEADGMSIGGKVRASQAHAVLAYNGTTIGDGVAAEDTPRVYLMNATSGGGVSITSDTILASSHLLVCGTHVNGDVSVSGMSHQVIVGGPARGCAGNSVQGGLNLTGNNVDAELVVAGNHLGRKGIKLSRNLGNAPKTVAGNTATGGKVSCDQNDSPIFATGNMGFKQIDGQCATAGPPPPPPAAILVPLSQPTIQAGIAAATDGATVLVAPGLYPERVNFAGKAIRVASLGGADGTIVDGKRQGSVVTFNSGEGAASTLEGFTLRHGAADSGGGIMARFGSPTISNDIIIENAACNGGGVFGWGSSLHIETSRISNNTTDMPQCGGGYGGGIDIQGGNAARVTRSSIDGNVGDGILMNGPGAATFEDDAIMNNTGPGINAYNHDEASIVQNVIAGNRGGGAAFLVGSGDRGPFLVNNTIASNVGTGLLIAGFASQTEVVNNIVAAAPGDIGLRCAGDIPILDHNDAYVPGGAAYESCGAGAGQNGNRAVDPMFNSAIDFHLQPGSPLVGAGNPSAPLLPQQDFDGNPRVVAGAVSMGAFEPWRMVAESNPDEAVGGGRASQLGGRSGMAR